MIARARAIALALFVLAFFTAPPNLFSASSETDNLQFTAQNDCTFALTVQLYKNTPFNGSMLSTMDFGTLQVYTDVSGAKTLRSSTSGSTGTGAVAAMIYPGPCGGWPYRITANTVSGPLTDSTTGQTIPSGACTVVPVYSPSDNDFGAGPQPLVGTMGTPGSWAIAGSPITLYTSDAAGNYRATQAYFSITDDPAAGATTGVPPDQQAGSYGGTILITMTAS